MREIEFRAKTIPKLLGVIDNTPQYTNSEWVYGYYAPIYLFEKDGKSKNTYCIISDKIIGQQEMMGCGVNSGLPVAYMILQDSLGQYTGLKDKNGKKIFEGDIILYDNVQKVVVFFENGQFVVNHYAINLLCERCNKSEVIGNLYDNPELIGE